MCHDSQMNSCEGTHHNANRRTEQMHMTYPIRPNMPDGPNSTQKMFGQKQKKEEIQLRAF
jgi:hypothetical protein